MFYFLWIGVLRALTSSEENASTSPGSGTVKPGWGKCCDDVLISEVFRPLWALLWWHCWTVWWEQNPCLSVPS